MIRPAAAHDATEISRLWNTMIRETLHTFTTVEKSADDVDEMIGSRGGAFFVAEADGRFAGFVTYGAFRSGPGYAHTAEHSIMVEETAKGTGVAAALLLAAEAAARRQGIRALVGGISGENPRAEAFHRKHGYTEVGRMPEVGCKHGRWLDLVLMQKILVRGEHSD